MSSLTYISSSESETMRIATEGRIQEGMIVALKGDLGAGKTAFVRGFCEKLGIRDVNSPTFAIVNDYGEVYHIDAYRLEGADPEDIGIWDYVNSERTVFVEWPEFLPIDYDVTISIRGSGDEAREITYEYTGD